MARGRRDDEPGTREPGSHPARVLDRCAQVILALEQEHGHVGQWPGSENGRVRRREPAFAQIDQVVVHRGRAIEGEEGDVRQRRGG
jgi:hypothetical protein